MRIKTDPFPFVQKMEDNSWYCDHGDLFFARYVGHQVLKNARQGPSIRAQFRAKVTTQSSVLQWA